MRTLMKIWRFLFPPDDWIIAWSDNAWWNVKYEYDEGSERKRKECFYIIKYSKFRNRYELFIEGYKPKQHNWYSVALTKLAEFQNKKDE